MKLDDVTPAHCYAHANQLWSDIRLIRTEMGRSEDPRPAPEITNAQPREVLFEAIAVWHKADRLASELGVSASRALPPAPAARDGKPGHCLQVIDGVLEITSAVKARLGITEASREPAIEPVRTPADVLSTLLRANRDLSRTLETPFTPTDVYRVVALASMFASRMGQNPPSAPFERARRPADCYAQLERCLALANTAITKKGQQALAERGTPADVVPGDVYDLANLVLGELAFLHSLGNHPPVHAYEPLPGGHRLPSHVHQLARTLEAQLAMI